LQSQTFDSASWGKVSATISANATTAPDGTLTADKLIANSGYDPTSATGNLTQSNVVTANTHTISVYAKAAEFTSIRFRENFSVGSFLTIDLTNGTITGGSSQYINPTATSVGDGWYRISFVTPATADLAKYSLRVANTGDGTSGVFIWGFQFETGDIATDYIATGASAVSVGPVSNVPRIDYTGGGCGKLLLEPQRTNLVTFSENFDNAAWTKSGCTATANALISPSGYQDADEINMAAPDASLLRQIVTVTASTAYTFSFYVKRGTATNLRYNVRDITNSTDITAKVDYTAQTSTTSWSRISVTFTTPVGCTSVGIFPNRDSSSAGTFYVWGAQLEAGSYATSYIPTLSTSVTRVADAASKTGITNLIGQTEGTIFFEVNDFSYNPQVVLFKITGLISSQTRTTNQIRFEGVGYDYFYTPTQKHLKIAAAYTASTIVIYINGTQVHEDTSVTITGGSNLLFNESGTGTEVLAQALLFKKRLSNDELAALTTL
jgi:hypothetical protein